MHVALAANHSYFPGLACAIFSIASATDRQEGIAFHIIDGGIDDVSWNLLERKLSVLSEEIRLLRYPISPAAFDGLPLGYPGPIAYARLLMQSLIEEDEVIYVDSDILCFRDLRGLWEDPMGDALIAACQDWGIQFLVNDSIFALNEEESRQRYFNSGFMKVNLKMWRQECVQSRTLALLRDFSAKCVFHDQTALNTVCQGKVKYLDNAWNRIYLEPLTLRDFTEKRINIHYASNAKPWQSYDKSVCNVVWRLYREKWMSGFRMPMNLPSNIKQSFYDVAVFLLNRWGNVFIGMIDAIRACLACLPCCARPRVLSYWLERQRAGIEIVRWAWERTSSLRPDGETARQ